ncbi:hypothetical protein [Mesorhizobium sp.]|uniref:hypothetical protein n=1 Tax=Mesorhizobium sp. TaxID=1871066 RepID=UPI000FE9C35E|nr:hypothetical protein [Mesorhizobium sp.]RWE78793.1 MAG: hypothetical protein EOS42_04210 [Mesorhizobium sp.]
MAPSPELSQASSIQARLRLLRARGLSSLVFTSIIVFVLAIFAMITYAIEQKNRAETLTREAVFISETSHSLTYQAKSIGQIIDEMKTIRDSSHAIEDKAVALKIQNSTDKVIDTLGVMTRENIRLLNVLGKGYPVESRALDYSFITTAQAEDRNAGDEEANEKILKASIRGYVYIGMVVSLLILLLMCTAAVFFTKNEKVFSFAVDTIKTLVGFFIGVLSSLFGLPGT